MVQLVVLARRVSF
ncbi:TPA: hypothetical protein RD391_004337 [Escherichia coli]|nr:hypothetical protein [Escherichia coli]HDT7402519.1 hypothetical protein [Escherichia coli]